MIRKPNLLRSIQFSRMKRLVSTLSALIMLSSIGRAYWLTEDIPNLIQSEINAVSAYVRQGLQYVKEAEISVNTNLTALRELQQIENELLALERMGNPSIILNLPGSQQIATLKEIYDQALFDVEQIQSFISPQGAQENCNAVLRQYGFGGWNGYTSGWGVRFSAPTPIIQFSSSNYQTSQYAKTRINSLIKQKQSLTQQRDAAISGLQAATDDTTKASYTAQINALNGAIADLNQTINQAVSSAQIQIGMNGSAQQMYNGMWGAQAAANFQQGEENGFSAMNGTAPGYSNGVVTGNSTEFGWVDGPQNGGNGDPGTSGSWDVGAGGANIGSQNSTGISLPMSTEVAMFGSEANALGQNVMVTDNNTGRSVSTQIVDVGPGSNAVAAGNIVDLTYGTARQLGIPVGQGSNVTVSKVQ